MASTSEPVSAASWLMVVWSKLPTVLRRVWSMGILRLPLVDRENGPADVDGGGGGDVGGGGAGAENKRGGLGRHIDRGRDHVEVEVGVDEGALWSPEQRRPRVAKRDRVRAGGGPHGRHDLAAAAVGRIAVDEVHADTAAGELGEAVHCVRLVGRLQWVSLSVGEGHRFPLSRARVELGDAVPAGRRAAEVLVRAEPRFHAVLVL